MGISSPCKTLSKCLTYKELSSAIFKMNVKRNIYGEEETDYVDMNTEDYEADKERVNEGKNETYEDCKMSSNLKDDLVVDGGNEKTTKCIEEEFEVEGEGEYPTAASQEWLNDEDLAFQTGDAAHKAFPDMPIVEVDDMDNRIGGANPYKDLGIPEPPDLKMGGKKYDDWPDVMGETAGMDDPPNAPWRLEAEELIRNAVESSGLNCSDILWTFHKVEVTVRRSDLPYDHEESGYVDSHQLSTCMKAVNDALVTNEDKLQVLVRHELIVATPGSSEILTTDRDFKTFKGFDVIVVAGGPPSPNFREIRGNLVQRTYDELVISQKGKLIRIPLVLVKEVRLPSAHIEDGDWLQPNEDLSTQLVSNDALVIPSSHSDMEGEEVPSSIDDPTLSSRSVLGDNELEEVFDEIFRYSNDANNDEADEDDIV